VSRIRSCGKGTYKYAPDGDTSRYPYVKGLLEDGVRVWDVVTGRGPQGRIVVLSTPHRVDAIHEAQRILDSAS
jgi:hypothetical protein